MKEVYAFQTRKSRTPSAPRYENLHEYRCTKASIEYPSEDRQVHAITVKVTLIPVYSMPQKGEGGKGQKEIHSLLENTNAEHEERIYDKKTSGETIESCKKHIEHLSDTHSRSKV